MVTIAKKPIIVWKNSTTQTNTKLSFVHRTLTKLESANMEISAHSLIQSLKYLSSSLTSLIKTLISTCFISRRCGVHIMRIITRETSVYSLIIGKIIDANHNFISTQRNNVLIGDRDLSSTITKTDVQTSINVSIVMAGKNKSIILRTIS
jgi:hypothetical protein